MFILTQIKPTDSAVYILFFVIGVVLTALIGAFINNYFSRAKEDKNREDSQEKRLMTLEIRLAENFNNDFKASEGYSKELVHFANNVNLKLAGLSDRIDKVENLTIDIFKEIILIKDKLK